MAELDWLEANDLRAYPLIDGDFSLSGGLTLPRKGLVDAGFMLGIDSYFEPGQDSIYLYSITIGLTTLTLRARAEYADAERDFLRCYEWCFSFALLAKFGETVHADATHIETSLPASDRGQGFITVGDLSELAALPLGEHLLLSAPSFEPALSQSLVRSFAKSINLANGPRPCPPICECEPSSSSSSDSSSDPSSSDSSSSSSPSGECTDPDPIEPDGDDHDAALPETVGLTGAIKLMPGYNCEITVVAGQNLVQIGAGVKSGKGAPCNDLRIDETGQVWEDLCAACDGPIYTLNGIGAETEHFQLIGGPSVVVTPNADEHEIVISLDEEGICEVDL